MTSTNDKNNSRIRVAHLTSVHKPFDVRIFQKECGSLVSEGYEVVLIAPHDRDETVDGVRIRAITKYRSRLRRMTKTVYQAYLIARRENADLYHLHDSELLPIGFLLRLTGKKIIFDMHENTPKHILSKSWVKPFLRKPFAKIFKLLEKTLMNGMHVIFAENSYEEDYLWVKHHATVLNMPISDKLLSLENKKNEIPTIAYFGTVDADRGSLQIIEMARMLKERNIPARWEIIGPCEETHRDELLERIKRDELCVNLHGYALPKVGWDIVSRCHIGLALIKATPNHVRSYSTKIFEYMALGIPVITSNFPLYEGVIDKYSCGVCADPLDTEAAVQAIIEIIKHPEEAEKMGERGKRAVLCEYNWNNEAKKLVDFYHEALNERDSMRASRLAD